MREIRNWCRTFIKCEHGAAEIVAVIVLAAIALIFAIAFRNEIGGLLSDIWQAVRGRQGELTADFEL